MIAREEREPGAGLAAEGGGDFLVRAEREGVAFGEQAEGFEDRGDGRGRSSRGSVSGLA